MPPVAADAQRAIVASLRRAPGQGIRQLHRSTGLALATIQKHVKALNKAGRIRFTRRSSYKLWHLPRSKLPPVTDALEERIYGFVKANPGARQIEIINAIPDVPRSTVQWHLRRMTN